MSRITGTLVTGTVVRSSGTDCPLSSPPESAKKTYGASVGKSLRTRVGIQRISIRLKQMCLAVAADCRREEQIP